MQAQRKAMSGIKKNKKLLVQSHQTVNTALFAIRQVQQELDEMDETMDV